MIRFVKVESEEFLKEVAILADEIWHDHFIDIIGKAQTDYMVEKFQSFRAMTEQIKEKNYSYYAFMQNNSPIGYFAIMPDGDRLFLSKLYLHKSQRGNGYASKAFEFLRAYCRENGFKSIWLTVNRNNKSSIDVYLHSGFEITGKQVADIGSGFVMDDYLMEMRVTDD